jgi:hypothetical protein
MMFYFQSGKLGHSTNTIILKSNEHKSYAWVFGVICTFQSRKAHAALTSVQTSARDVERLPVKLRLMTGTYYLQSNKAAFNQNRIDPTCLVCQMEPETLEHFLLDCNVLAETREPYISELNVLI